MLFPSRACPKPSTDAHKVELSRRNLTTFSLQACVYTVRWRVPSPRHWTPSRAGRCTVIYTPQSAPTQPRILLQRGTTALRRVPFLAGAARLGPGRRGRRRLGVPMSLSRSGVHPAPLWVYDDDGGGGHVRGRGTAQAARLSLRGSRCAHS
jgi:hypothetical protein